MMLTVKDAALKYRQAGWSVFPLLTKNQPHIQWREFQSTLPTIDQILDWWTQWPEAMIGVALGEVSNLVRVDADGPEAAAELEKLGGLPDTLTFRTPSGGQGWLLQFSPCLKTEVLWNGPGEHQELRIQSTGAYTVLPPSAGYSWLNDTVVAEIPQWLNERIVLHVLTQLDRELNPIVRDIDKGEVLEAMQHIPADDYNTWISVGMALHSMDVNMLDTWIDWSRRSEKFELGLCERKWATFTTRPGGRSGRSILFLAEREYGWVRTNKYEPLSDLGNARILAKVNEGKIKHCSLWGWLAWADGRWITRDAEKLVQEMQKGVLDLRVAAAEKSIRKFIHSAAKDAPDYSKKLRHKIGILKSIRVHESEPHIRGARILARSEPRIITTHETFNTHPFLLNCTNGTLDLQTGQLLEHNPEHLLTQQCPHPYLPDAQAPRWEQFIQEVFVDPELIAWFQRLMGYCLTGDTSLHILPIMHGSGCNGKSTVIRALFHVLGSDYAGSTPPKFLAMSHGEQHPTRIAELHGKRFAVDMETSDGMRLDEELVKRLTGGDELRARRMYQDFWKFNPTHKLFLVTNHEPKVQDADDSIWRRVLKVPFKQSFIGREDHGLSNRLCAEAPGILRWLVDGCTQWRVNGLGELPKVVQAATQEYRTEQNTLLMFFNEKLMKEAGAALKKSDLTGAYNVWCHQQRVRQAGSKVFGQQLRAWYGADTPLDMTAHVYKGIKFVS